MVRCIDRPGRLDDFLAAELEREISELVSIDEFSEPELELELDSCLKSLLRFLS